MKKLTQEEEIKKILEQHKHWLAEDCDGWENMRANFYNCDLRYADLSYADLSYADLSSANLRYANLRYADLSYADLSYADLSSANLRYANLRYADLSSANLSSANLSYADLSYADLSSAKEVPYIPMICPEEGEFIGWKKARNNIIAKLLIPSDAKRSSSTTRKCRCNKAKVLELYNFDGTVATEREVYSLYDNSFVYKVGETVVVKNFDENRWSECAKGIHFFLNRQEAINYNF